MIDRRVPMALLALLAAGCDGGARAAPGYRLEVTAAPPAAAGEPSRLGLAVRRDDGTAVRTFQPLHGQPMHLIATSTDLEEFHHVHPTLRGDGHLFADLELRGTAPYALFAEVAPEGDDPQGRALRHLLWPERAEGRFARLDGAAAFDGRAARASAAGPVSVRLEALASPLRAGVPAALQLAVADMSGAPLTPDEWLGMPVHALSVSEDLKEFLHFHGAYADGAAPAGHEHHHHHAGPAAPSSRLTVHAAFPAPGLYKLWAQVKVAGQVFTAPFVVRVERA